MRIVHYHPRALVGDGGVSNSVRRLSRAIAEAGEQAAIVYDGRDGNQPDPGPVEWIPLAHRGVGEVQLPVGLERVLRPGDALVLNSAWTAHNARAGAVAHRLGIPYVVAARGAYDPLIMRRRPAVKRLWWTSVEGRLVRRAAALHVFFAEQADHAHRLGFGGRIVVAPNGITVPDNVVWDGGSGGYLLYLGRFDPEHKGLDLLLDAVAAQPEADRPQVRLVGPDWKGGLDVVVRRIATLGLGSWVTTAPAVYGAEKWEVLQSAAGFLYPSRWEGFGNSLAEAAAIGVPALATPYPLATHLAGRGAAVVVPPERLAEGLRELAQRPSPPPSVAAEVRAGFTWPAVARAWLDGVAGLASSP